MRLFRDPSVRRALLLSLGVTALAAVLAAQISPAAVILSTIACLCVCAIFVVLTARRDRAVTALSETVDHILHGADDLTVSGCAEGELSLLADEIGKMVVRLREQTDRMERDRSRMSDALADVSHQLRTPLTSMNLTLSRLSGGDLAPEERMRLLFELKQRLARIDWLVETLLKLSKIDAGTVHFRHDEVQVSELLRAASEPLAVAMELRGQTLTVEVGEETYIGDLAWTTEAIGNLLKNCSEHTPEGGIVTVTAHETALYTEIAIRDSGGGFEPTELPYLFDRFYRGKNAAPNSVGIGLSLARTVITAQGGTLTAANAHPCGALFTVRFYKSVV